MSTVESQTVSRYLEAIYYIDAEGERVKAARLAEWLGVSQPTAGATLQRMVRDGLVQISGIKDVSLTARGRDTAAAVVRRHRVAERWLTDVLGLDWLAADEEAGRLEHALSDAVTDRLYKLIGEPRTCPHGNPIPGLQPPYDRTKLVTLSELKVGEWGRLSLLTEDVELVTDVLAYFEEKHLMPGASIEVTGIGPDGTLTLQVDGTGASLGSNLADNLWVLPQEAPQA